MLNVHVQQLTPHIVTGGNVDFAYGNAFSMGFPIWSDTAPSENPCSNNWRDSPGSESSSLSFTSYLVDNIFNFDESVCPATGGGPEICSSIVPTLKLGGTST